MGYFSFCDADTGESIPVSASDRFDANKPVYLLQPNGQPSIQEDCYEGFGVFGGIDCYEWLAKVNFGTADAAPIAICASVGSYLEDDDNIYLCSLHIPPSHVVYFRAAINDFEKPVIFFPNYEAAIPQLGGVTMNAATAKGQLRQRHIGLTYPLKFSFDPHAKYEDLPASENCPYQGYFY